jgi:hypothetical protein
MKTSHVISQRRAQGIRIALRAVRGGCGSRRGHAREAEHAKNRACDFIQRKAAKIFDNSCSHPVSPSCSGTVSVLFYFLHNAVRYALQQLADQHQKNYADSCRTALYG